MLQSLRTLTSPTYYGSCPYAVWQLVSYHNPRIQEKSNNCHDYKYSIENLAVELRVLKADRTAGSAWLVEEGLNAGDRLITEGLQFVQPGAEVKAVPATNVKTEQPAQDAEPANGQD